MATESTAHNLKLVADAETVEELVDRVCRGSVRIPIFQRGLRWRSDDVIDLFDSIYRGYPIGSFLLSRDEAPADRIRIGPLVIDAPETHAAWWVVDGQQRLTTLTAGLSRPVPVPVRPVDPWVVYFDARSRTFHVPPESGEIPSTWIPVAQFLDASALSEWIGHWQHQGDETLRASVFQAAARIRQYRIPLYLLEAADERQLREIFVRTHHSRRSLSWTEVHDALFAHRGAHPSTLGDLAEELQRLGMGRPDEAQILSCLSAFKGLDVTRNVAGHLRRDPEIFASAVPDALPVLRSTLSFLRRSAEIPHLRLLPRSFPLFVLTRFFALFPAPAARTSTLLVRWTWRALLSPGLHGTLTFLRQALAAIEEGAEERSTQNLLALVPRTPTTSYALPDRFDARGADSRLALLGLASLKPRALNGDDAPFDVAELVQGVEAFRRIFPEDPAMDRSPANRILLPGSGAAHRELLERARNQGGAAPALWSHAVSPAAVEALLAGDHESFLAERKTSIEAAVHGLGTRLAAWSRSDRPSISYILREAGEEVEAEA
jgi:hypothetical protein